MGVAVIPFHYLWWHYVLAWEDFFRIWRDFLWFTYHFFSIPSLVRHLGAPWKRLGESYKRGFDPSAFFATLIVNVLMRAVGLVMRFILLIVGLLSWSVVLVLGLGAIVVWLIAPALVVGLLAAGFYLFL